MRLGRPGYAIAVLVALSLKSTPARAADIHADGQLVFAQDALATYGFESIADLIAAGAERVARASREATPVTPDDDAALFSDASGALEGCHALLVRPGATAGLALHDDALFEVSRGGRLVVTMWGRAFGVEPALALAYAPPEESVGSGKVRVQAIRTGRETSDGWAEYTTGPVDGAAWEMPLRAIVLTARCATDDGASLLTESSLPGGSCDDDAYAVIDAVEVRPVAGPATPAAPCTQATVGAACGAHAECMFGHCIDAAFAWGPVPVARSDRADLAARLAFEMVSLHGDREAARNAAVSFAGAAGALAGETSPRGYYGELNKLVTGIRDSHTTLGMAPSSRSVVYPLVDRWSGPLDVCFGVAEDDLGSGETVFAIFSVGSQPSIRETLRRGDVLTAIDGLAPKAWLSAVAPRFMTYHPSDPSADPSHDALLLSKLLGRYAETVTLSRCQPEGGCAPLPPIPVADEVFQIVRSTGTYRGSTVACSPRFHSPVPVALGLGDAVTVQTQAGVTSVHFDGFQPLRSSAWKEPWARAVEGHAKLLVDARLGHGGSYALGKYLFRLLRGAEQPYGMFVMPRGAYDDPDPPWLFEPRWDACPSDDVRIDACRWSGGQTTFADDAAPPGLDARVAWVNGNDVSMNDIVPRLLGGRRGFRVFGPHPSHGAYGAVSKVPPILSSWGARTLQTFDSRFGPTPALARAAPWASGKGVVPDEVVVQKVSDILRDRDTVLDAAKAWLTQ